MSVETYDLTKKKCYSQVKVNVDGLLTFTFRQTFHNLEPEKLIFQM